MDLEITTTDSATKKGIRDALNAQALPIVISGNKTAIVGETYHNTANATYTDPTSPVEGQGFRVVVIGGTATVGGVAYSRAGATIERNYLSGSWQTNRVYNDNEAEDGIAFLECFDRADQYANGDTVTSGVTMPLIGNALRIRTLYDTTGDPPTVQNGGLIAEDGSLYYLGSNVPSYDGKFSMGFTFDCLNSTINPNGVFGMDINVSFNSSEMIATNGMAIYPAGVMHINWDQSGIKQIDFYGTGIAPTCLNRTYNGANYPWKAFDKPALGGIAPNRRYTILFEVDGDELTVTLVGYGSIIFTHPDMSNCVGSDTHFWWEPSGDTYAGQAHRYVSKLVRMWANAPKLNNDAKYGAAQEGLAEFMSTGRKEIPGTVHYLKDGENKVGDYIMPTGIRLFSGGDSSVTRGTRAYATGGHIMAEGGVLSNVGDSAAGGLDIGRAVMATNEEITNGLKTATTGADVVLKTFERMYIAEAGDKENWKIYVRLTGAANQRVMVKLGFLGTVIFDSNAISTPLDGVTGFMIIKMHRKVEPIISDIIYTEAIVNNAPLHVQRAAFAYADNYAPLQFIVNQSAADSIILEDIERTVVKVINM